MNVGLDQVEELLAEVGGGLPGLEPFGVRVALGWMLGKPPFYHEWPAKMVARSLESLGPDRLYLEVRCSD